MLSTLLGYERAMICEIAQCAGKKDIFNPWTRL
jgi:hypothetical protein